MTPPSKGSKKNVTLLLFVSLFLTKRVENTFDVKSTRFRSDGGQKYFKGTLLRSE